jgi:hypothetical protein
MCGTAIAAHAVCHDKADAPPHTYLRMSGLRIGLILNSNARRLTEGIRRCVA